MLDQAVNIRFVRHVCFNWFLLKQLMVPPCIFQYSFKAMSLFVFAGATCKHLVLFKNVVFSSTCLFEFSSKLDLPIWLIKILIFNNKRWTLPPPPYHRTVIVYILCTRTLFGKGNEHIVCDQIQNYYVNICFSFKKTVHGLH